MKLIIKNIVFALCFAFTFLACSQSKATIIDAEELIKMQGEGVAVIDVRTQEEVKDGKIPGAVNVVLSSDFAMSMTAYNKDEPVIVYCRSGRRSTNASEQLVNAGFTQVFNYAGSFNDWNALKKPIENKQ